MAEFQPSPYTDMIPRPEAERMPQEARAVALREAAEVVRHWRSLFCGSAGVTDAAVFVDEVANDILALIDTPAAEALGRVLDEEREACAQVAGQMFVPFADTQNASVGLPPVGQQIAATIRARKGGG